MDVLTRVLEVGTAIQCRMREEKTQENGLRERLSAAKCGRHYTSYFLCDGMKSEFIKGFL